MPSFTEALSLHSGPFPCSSCSDSNLVYLLLIYAGSKNPVLDAEIKIFLIPPDNSEQTSGDCGSRSSWKAQVARRNADGEAGQSAKKRCKNGPPLLSVVVCRVVDADNKRAGGLPTDLPLVVTFEVSNMSASDVTSAVVYFCSDVKQKQGIHRLGRDPALL